MIGVEALIGEEIGLFKHAVLGASSSWRPTKPENLHRLEDSKTPSKSLRSAKTLQSRKVLFIASAAIEEPISVKWFRSLKKMPSGLPIEQYSLSQKTP